MIPSPDLIALARTAAKHALDFSFCADSQTYSADALVCAVVEQESAWDTHAIRYEPAFRTRYVAPLGLPPTEEIARSMSWGLMQVMGQVAREHGFAGKFLSALCEPAASLDVGCAVLAAKLTIRPGSSSRGSSATEGSASASGAENQQQIPRTAPRAPASAGENQTARDSARDDNVLLLPQSGQGIALGENTTTRILDESIIARALQLWNGGANPDYAAQVLARLPKYRGLAPDSARS